MNLAFTDLNRIEFKERIRKVRSIITDFDRTLLQLFDDEMLSLLKLDLISLYEEAGLEIGSFQAYVNPYAIWAEIYPYLVSRIGARGAGEIHQAASAIFTDHENRAAHSASLYPGVHETLEWLYQNGLLMAIVSSNSTKAVRVALETNEVSGFFSCIRGRNDGEPTAKLKPNPEPILEVLRKMRATSDSAIFVGDSREDAISACSAGLVAIGVLTGMRNEVELREAGASIIISSFSDLRLVFRNADMARQADA